MLPRVAPACLLPNHPAFFLIFFLSDNLMAIAPANWIAQAAGRSVAKQWALTPIETEEPRLAVKSKTGLSITPRIHGNKEMGTVNAR